jgi:hypothetical protein
MLNMDVPLIALAGHNNVEFLAGLDTEIGCHARHESVPAYIGATVRWAKLLIPAFPAQ